MLSVSLSLALVATRTFAHQRSESQTFCRHPQPSLIMPSSELRLCRIVPKKALFWHILTMNRNLGLKRWRNAIVEMKNKEIYLVGFTLRHLLQSH